MSLAAILFGSSLHHLDHLAPLASLLQIPLIIEDEKIHVLAKKYYPHLKTLQCDPKETRFFALQHFSTLITCLPRPIIEQEFFLAALLLKKPLSTIWCPHGNSDKGRASFFMEGLQKESIVLTYGERMENFLKEKKVSQPRIIRVGNYRYRYFLQHRDFYQTLLKKELLAKINIKKKILLYAPTWFDQENSSSFSKDLLPLFRSLQNKVNLIIKPHPNLFHTHSQEIEMFEESDIFLLLKDFPTIYPLLSIVDAYLGDMSSIGYDFLTFQKPMFFFKSPLHLKDKSSYFLHECGHELSRECPKNLMEKLLSLLEKKDPFSKRQKEIYDQTFSSPDKFSFLKNAWR
jgi:hypothetical protein